MKNVISIMAGTLLLGSMLTFSETAYSQMERASLSDGGFLLYETAGNPNGEAVLMIHGGYVAASFLPIMDEPELSDYFLIRYHRRGYGGSSNTEVGGRDREAQDAFELLAHLGISKAHVVGHSGGGPIALEMAASQPVIVHSLAILEGAPIFTIGRVLERRGITLEQYQQRVEANWANTRAQSTRPELVDQFFHRYYGENWQSAVPNIIPGAIEQARDDIQNNWLSSVSSRTPFDDDFFEAITQPVLYLISKEGETNFGYSIELHSQVMPHMTKRIVSDMPNHLFQMGFPEQTARELSVWLAEHPF